jgi:hypothetical protein
VGCVGGVGGVGGVGVWGHSLRSTFHRLHLLRLWTPTILLILFLHRIKKLTNTGIGGTVLYHFAFNSQPVVVSGTVNARLPVCPLPQV